MPYVPSPTLLDSRGLAIGAIVGAVSGPLLRSVIVNCRQLAQVGLGLIGVWALVVALNGFMTFAAIFGREATGAVLISIGLPVLLLLGLSYVLVFHNIQLATAISPDPAATIEPGSTDDLARTLIVLLGVFLLVQAIPGTLNGVLAYLAAGEFPNTTIGLGPLRGFIGHVVQIAIAIWLIRRPERLLDYVRRPRPVETE